MIKHNGKKCTIEGCNNPLYARGMCKYHYNIWLMKRMRDKKKNAVKVYSAKPNKKNSGEVEVFKMIWNERNRSCFISGECLEKYTNQFHWLFHHILPKSTYPKLRLLKNNIVLLSPENHDKVHRKAESDLVKEDPKWKEYFELKNKLKIKYS